MDDGLLCPTSAVAVLMNAQLFQTKIFSVDIFKTLRSRIFE